MSTHRDYLGETLRLVERGREDAYFRQIDQELLARMRQQEAAQAAETALPQRLFTPMLIPVDFSPYAAEALLCAADLADVLHTSLIVLHVMASDAGAYVPPQPVNAPHASDTTAPTTSVDAARTAAEQVFDAHREQVYKTLQDFLPPRLGRHPVELRVVVGRPFERILETAVREHVGLIILGTHGRTGLARVTMGSVAERVVRLAPCPVLTVKATTPESTSWLQSFYESLMHPTHT